MLRRLPAAANADTTRLYSTPLYATLLLLLSQLTHPAPPSLSRYHQGSFLNHACTPNCYRYDPASLAEHNVRFNEPKKEHPIYTSTTSEFGKMQLQETDMHMRW